MPYYQQPSQIPYLGEEGRCGLTPHVSEEPREHSRRHTDGGREKP